MAGFADDPHSEQGYDCPRNLLGITSFARLTLIERVFVHKRLHQMARAPIDGAFDTRHLQDVHRYIFQDVFPWAGEFRVVDMSKGSTQFGRAIYIESSLSALLDRLKQEALLRGLSSRDFAERAGYYLGEINAVHPFREGNGRTQREFIRQLAEQAGHPLSWSGSSRDEMTAASILCSVRGDSSQMVSIVEHALDRQTS